MERGRAITAAACECHKLFNGWNGDKARAEGQEYVKGREEHGESASLATE